MLTIPTPSNMRRLGRIIIDFRDTKNPFLQFEAAKGYKDANGKFIPEETDVNKAYQNIGTVRDIPEHAQHIAESLVVVKGAITLTHSVATGGSVVVKRGESVLDAKVDGVTVTPVGAVAGETLTAEYYYTIPAAMHVSSAAMATITQEDVGKTLYDLISERSWELLIKSNKVEGEVI